MQALSIFFSQFFINPWGLWFLLSVPFLVLLYFLKLKRPQLTVSSTLLWQKVIEDMRVNSPFQRLKRSLLLLLQLLALLLLIAALARPLLNAIDRKESSIIVLVDTSASMSAREENGKSRFDMARDNIREQIDNLGKRNEMMIISFDSKARILCRFTSNKRFLRESLDKAVQSQRPTNLEPALVLTRSMSSARNNPRCLLYTDGAFTPPPKVNLPMTVEYHPVGTDRPNVAITGLDIRRSMEDRQNVEMFVAIQNFSDQPFKGNMTVYLDDQALDSKVYNAAANETLSQIFQAVLPVGGVIRVEVDADDAMKADNIAWKVVPPPVHRSVLIVGGQSYFIKRVLMSTPGTRVETIEDHEYTETLAADYNTVIWNGVDSPGKGPGHNLYLGCHPDLGTGSTNAAIQAPDIMDWDNTHPINRFIDYSNLIIAESPDIAFPDNWTSLLRSSKSPLISLSDEGGRGTCVVTFDPIKSNWPLLVSFPIFLNNTLNTFAEIQSRVRQSNIQIGEAITAPAYLENPRITDPGGVTRDMAKFAQGDYSFTEVNKGGVYTVHTSETDSYSIAANLFDRQESSLNIVNDPVIDGERMATSGTARDINKEFWKPLLLIACGLLLLEWLVYHQRWFT
jgi:hypothetical protein